MVAESGDGVFGGGLAVRVGGGADGGVADRGGVEAEEGVFAEAEVVEGGDLHEEVVGVLAVDDGLAEGGFALLEELGVLAGADGGGFEREHGAQGELAVSTVLPERRMAMGMSQLVEKNLSPPRMTGGRQGTLNCAQVAGEGPVGWRRRVAGCRR